MFEWRTEPLRKHDPILSETMVEGSVFRSVYWFDSEAVKHVQKTQSTAGLNAFSVSSRCLYVDVDNIANLPKVESIINGLGAPYSKWSTGNRGAHFHIEIEPMQGDLVPPSQAAFVESLGLKSLVDMSIYRHHSIFRIPGAVHKKTGKKKKMVYEILEGDPLTIPIKQPTQVVYHNMESGSASKWKRFKLNIIQQRGPGQRHQHLYILFVSGLEAGLSSEDVLSWMLWWNSIQDQPHTESAVRNKWRSFNVQKNPKSYASL